MLKNSIHINKFIVFTDIGPLPFLKRGFKHCFVVEEGELVWLIHERHISHQATRVEIKEDHPAISDLFKDCSIIKVDRYIKGGYSLIFGLHTCVVHALSCVGYSPWWVLTPWQLYKYLKAKGYGEYS